VSRQLGNANTQSDYRRDLALCLPVLFGRESDGAVDIAMIMTRPQPTLDGAHWPWPPIAAWRPALPSCMIEPIWIQFAALLPTDACEPTSTVRGR
jgi:hypothetical protein